MKKYLLFISLAILTSCESEINESEDIKDIADGTRAIVVNEGQFGYGTSSLTLLTWTGNVTNDVFRKVNNRPMGDVAQSLTKIGDNYYVPLNNSRKIEAFDSKTFESVETMSINEDVIPMYVQHLGGDSIAVPDQMWRNSSSKLMIMDINHKDKNRRVLRRYIKMEGQTYQMQLVNNKLFVGGSQLSVFDLENLTEQGRRYIRNSAGDSFALTDFSKIVVDKDGMLWVLTGNNVYRIDPNTELITNSIDVSDLKINERIGCIDISPDGNTVYFNSSRRVYTINIDDIKKPQSPIIEPVIESRRTIYNMCVSKENTIFMCAVVYGSLSRAQIHEFNIETGECIRTFNAGLFPHFIYFTEDFN